jgi:hypothetical protein
MRLISGRVFLVVAVACAGVAAAVACSQSTTPPFLPDLEGGTHDGSPLRDTGTDAANITCASEDGGCNTLQTCGAKIYIVEVAANAPDASGGAVLDGTYVLKDYKVFTGTGGMSGQLPAWFKETMALATEAADAAPPDGGSLQQMTWMEVSQTNSLMNPRSANGTAYFTMPNAGLFIGTACPSNGAPFYATFTVNGTDLVLFVADTGGTGQLTYARQ